MKKNECYWGAGTVPQGCGACEENAEGAREKGVPGTASAESAEWRDRSLRAGISVVSVRAGPCKLTE